MSITNINVANNDDLKMKYFGDAVWKGLDTTQLENENQLNDFDLGLDCFLEG